MTDREKFLQQARSYIGVDGEHVCKIKLGLVVIVDWCAYAISAIMNDCGFIGKYQSDIYGFASDAAREDSGELGEWFRKDMKSPQPGDYIMFRYAGLDPLDKYSASHVGIVESVDGNIITTLEGNVDGYGSNWAGTSKFRRKTRYLSSPDVYAFYRPYWQGEDKSKSTSTGSKASDIDITYQVHTIDGSWLPEVTNLDDFAGLEGKAIDGVRAHVSKGHIRYRVKCVGDRNYLPWVRDLKDYAGIYGKPIECVQMHFYGVDGYIVEYRVSPVGGKYLPFVRNYNVVNDDGYAGIDGLSVDRLQAVITKK
jgi:hypothetical protein